ncbi:hypothetical protein MRB53_005243 [Persea americana]|uniref:Uncharacterized protein n=1 Tax=Persea americana TaxID=3435 RepID=A0ACC2MCS7_PERAE|nr:hypothetical protein MRB53_005243 [Persea americana]|eukprot:TRINITY_DN80268_c0_g1_i1.p1 TRINITY_DN80268_c0_g1~~TRINITY_DN80268_c0_g1_i1.p1  ORF type:complete len:337 (+),score=86.37 TRINITY_DN80268_c0_g1_i1:632-1642(+)
MLLDALPSCFSIPTTNHTTMTSNTTTTKMQQNLVTCIYQTHICNTPTFLTLTWSKTLSAHSLTINIDTFSLSISLSPPSSFSFFRNKPGSKFFSLTHHHHQHRPKLHWDFTHAQFSSTSAEPISGFYLAITHKTHIEFLLGDLHEAALHQSHAVHPLPRQPTLLSRREHIFGQRKYGTKTQFLGSIHEIAIECSGGALRVKVDGKVGLVVKRLAWKFRGKEKILVDGTEVDFYWDVFDWVFGSADGGGGHGVFVFQVGDGGMVWPEMVGPEKRLMRKSVSSSSSSPGNCSVLQWAEESSDGGSRSRSCSSSSSSSSFVSSSGIGGFSLLLYAWRTD